MKITVHIHPITAACVLEREDGPQRIAGIVGAALGVLRKHGTRVAYAPLAVSGDIACAMSVRRNAGGAVIELDAPGTDLPGRGVVIERDFPRTDRRAVRRA